MYHFDLTLRPYGAAPGEVKVSTADQRGYWEYADGTEGGELLFQGRELIDYDGAFELPRKVVAALRAAGFELDEDFDPLPGA